MECSTHFETFWGILRHFEALWSILELFEAFQSFSKLFLFFFSLLLLGKRRITCSTRSEGRWSRRSIRYTLKPSYGFFYWKFSATNMCCRDVPQHYLICRLECRIPGIWRPYHLFLFVGKTGPFEFVSSVWTTGPSTPKRRSTLFGQYFRGAVRPVLSSFFFLPGKSRISYFYSSTGGMRVCSTRGERGGEGGGQQQRHSTFACL